MTNPSQICFYLTSDIFPCPWIKHIPQIKRVRDRLKSEIVPLDAPLPDYLIETIELCEGCRHYDPIDVFRRVG